MINVPPIFKSLKFWESLSYIAAGVLGLLVLWGKIDPSQAWTPAAILAWIIAFLKMLGIEPELKAKGLIK